MKKFLITLVALLTLGNFSASAQKIAHLNYEKVMDTLQTYKKAMELVNESQSVAEESAQYLNNEIQKKMTIYQTEGSTMTKLQLEILEGEIGNLDQRLKGVELQYQSEMQTIQDRYLKKIEEWFKAAVEIVGKAKGLDYILYNSEQGSVFWVNPTKGVDVTNEVIAEMLKQEIANPVPVPGGG